MDSGRGAHIVLGCVPTENLILLQWMGHGDGSG